MQETEREEISGSFRWSLLPNPAGPCGPVGIVSLGSSTAILEQAPRISTRLPFEAPGPLELCAYSVSHYYGMLPRRHLLLCSGCNGTSREYHYASDAV